jgi:hypothetical protein
MNRNQVIDARCKHWIALNSCRQFKLWIKHPKLQTTKNLMSLPKKQLRILVSLITGHCCLNKHLHRMGLATNPVCASCQLEEEPAFHFVCVCPTLTSCYIENTHFWQSYNDCVGIYRGFGFRNPAVCFPKRKIRDKPLTQLS